MLDLYYSCLSAFQAACKELEISDTELFVSGEYFLDTSGEVLCTEFYSHPMFIRL